MHDAFAAFDSEATIKTRIFDMTNASAKIRILDSYQVTGLEMYIHSKMSL